MLNVFLSIDTEIWCDNWRDIDKNFPDAFRRYVYGNTKHGDYGIPYQLRVLNNYGLNGIFFVEPLFSGRFGREPLTEIVGLINDGGQEVQLHLHTEWVDESKEEILSQKLNKKKQHMRYFSLQNQEQIIRKGLLWLAEAGAVSVNAFRAGSFGMNLDTLTALKANDVLFDSSYNATMCQNSGIDPELFQVDSREYMGVFEYPMTVYEDRPGHLRHVQIAACSFNEIESLLWQALENGKKSFVILSHNFELFDPRSSRANKINIQRFNKLCQFLDKNRDSFKTHHFNKLKPESVENNEKLLKSSLLKTGYRLAEQLVSRIW